MDKRKYTRKEIKERKRLGYYRCQQRSKSITLLNMRCGRR